MVNYASRPHSGKGFIPGIFKREPEPRNYSNNPYISVLTFHLTDKRFQFSYLDVISSNINCY